MSRYALGVEYAGSSFHGWQRQVDENRTPTVQGALETALSRIADHPVAVRGCGRTDAGVHAALQVAQFDSNADRAPENWLRGANTQLPETVRIRWVKPVSDDFEARFGALSRSYLYLVSQSPVAPSLPGPLVLHERRPLDVSAMQRSALALVGEHDFSAFRAAACESRTPWRRVFRVSVGRFGELVALRIQANAFLLHMVRNITGSLLAVGRGEQPPEWMGQLLDGRDRSRAAPTAPPDGLYLCGAAYPLRYGLPERERLPWLLGAALADFWAAPGSNG